MGAVAGTTTTPMISCKWLSRQFVPTLRCRHLALSCRVSGVCSGGMLRADGVLGEWNSGLQLGHN